MPYLCVRKIILLYISCLDEKMTFLTKNISKILRNCEKTITFALYKHIVVSTLSYER